MKDVCFMGSSLDDIKNFPAGARRDTGFELSNVQSGLHPSDWKPMSTVGSVVSEIRIKPVSRYLVKDFGTSMSPKSTRKRDAYCAPAALRPCYFATPSQARRWLRSTPSNGWTAC